MQYYWSLVDDAAGSVELAVDFKNESQMRKMPTSSPMLAKTASSYWKGMITVILSLQIMVSMNTPFSQTKFWDSDSAK